MNTFYFLKNQLVYDGEFFRMAICLIIFTLLYNYYLLSRVIIGFNFGMQKLPPAILPKIGLISKYVNIFQNGEFTDKFQKFNIELKYIVCCERSNSHAHQKDC